MIDELEKFGDYHEKLDATLNHKKIFKAQRIIKKVFNALNQYN